MACCFSHVVLARLSFLAWGPHASPLDLDHLFIRLKSTLLASLSRSISEFSSFRQLDNNISHEQIPGKGSLYDPVLWSSPQKVIEMRGQSGFERGNKGLS